MKKFDLVFFMLVFFTASIVFVSCNKDEESPSESNITDNTVQDSDSTEETRLYVKTDGNNDNNGYSWTNALQSLSTALSLASENSKITEIWFAQGSYYSVSHGYSSVQ